MNLIKKINNLNFDNILKISISILFILLPFLDMFRTTSIKDIEIFNVSLIEFINIFLIGISLLITIFKLLKNKDKKISIIVFFLLISMIYIFFHYKNIIKFDTTIFQKASFNFSTESFYIFRVYILPLILLFILIQNKDIFNKEFYLKIAKIVIFVISMTILFLNIFKISYGTYIEGHKFVSHNLFDYFLYNGDFKLLATRGWFDSANELSAILLMFLPINIYILYTENKKFNVFLLFCHMLAMIALGTRVSAFGSCALCLFILCCYIIIKYIKKETMKMFFIRSFGIITLICIAYLTISPTMMARINDGFYDFSINNQEAYNNLKDIKKYNNPKQLEKLFQKYSDEYKVNVLFLKMYPIKNDMKFWIKIFQRNKALNNNSRVMKLDIIERIQNRNNNPMDKYFGMGYTLNFMDAERDYIYQYYLFGIIGVVIFILPYIVVVIVNIIKALFNFKANFKFRTMLTFAAPCLILIAAYLSGHVFGWVSPMLFLALSLGLLNITICDNEKKKGNAK